MAKFPEPPDPGTLVRRAPAETRSLEAGTLLWRVYFRGGRYPTLWNIFRRFGPAGARFDHHEPDAAGLPTLGERGVLYAARDGVTCVAEVFQRLRVIERRRDAPWLVAFRTTRAPVLLDLCGSWPTRAGASAVLTSGPRPRARRWSRVIHTAFPEVDGLLYPSSMRGSAEAIVLYERAADALPPSPAFHRALDDAALDTVLRNAAFELGYRLI